MIFAISGRPRGFLKELSSLGLDRVESEAKKVFACIKRENGLFFYVGATLLIGAVRYYRKAIDGFFRPSSLVIKDLPDIGEFEAYQALLKEVKNQPATFDLLTTIYSSTKELKEIYLSDGVIRGKELITEELKKGYGLLLQKAQELSHELDSVNSMDLLNVVWRSAQNLEKLQDLQGAIEGYHIALQIGKRLEVNEDVVSWFFKVANILAELEDPIKTAQAHRQVIERLKVFFDEQNAGNYLLEKLLNLAYTSAQSLKELKDIEGAKEGYRLIMEKGGKNRSKLGLSDLATLVRRATEESQELGVV